MTKASSEEFTVTTPRGAAQVKLYRPTERAVGVLALGHGAGGGVDAPDLAAVRVAAVGARFVVGLVTQPYRVLGRKAPPAAPALDEAWLATIAAVREAAGAKLPLVVGGRSSGARVACRTARLLHASGVLALAFPLHPPGKPTQSRAGELDPAVPTLVINGDADPFGVPDPVGQVQVVIRPGDRHDLRRDPAGVARTAVAWLRDLPGIASLKRTN